ncbi:iron-siderophore ABC transporter substrate-binding protein [Williamsia sterculiae]|uniref:Iron complex transport system substrate-binding protein n=1 Tax=Williamsia sterculiae TaxID=1344003 RepID=A0A1N7FKG0_9NOCA|nr:iron-siderophore ABC transporter substrate-binding protein [Williamsia sterculiae]SIS00852.1 iron complex transport system substrate-binding protein [Williamsia sterculiae]
MPHLPGLTRRHFLLAGLGSLGALGVAGCGRADSSSPASSSVAPARVTHKYGSTEVPANPRRVVTLGYTDQEPVLGLGVKPVGVVDFFGERPYGKWPWEASIWAGQQPTIVGERDTYNFGKIASLEPDLILGMYSGMTKADYDKLSGIAATVAQPVGHADFAAPWTVITQLAGDALGRRAQADRAIAAVQAEFTTARDAHPQWKGQTVAVVEPAKVDEWAVFGAGDPKLQFTEGLGFTVFPAVRAFNPGGDVKNVSTERLDTIDADRVIFLIDTGDQTEQQVRENTLFRTLKVARTNCATFLPFEAEPPIGAALAFNSIISIPYGIDQVVARLNSQP